jgi:hypothetical protein
LGGGINAGGAAEIISSEAANAGCLAILGTGADNRTAAFFVVSIARFRIRTIVGFVGRAACVDVGVAISRWFTIIIYRTTTFTVWNRESSRPNVDAHWFALCVAVFVGVIFSTFRARKISAIASQVILVIIFAAVYFWSVANPATLVNAYASSWYGREAITLANLKPRTLTVATALTHFCGTRCASSWGKARRTYASLIFVTVVFGALVAAFSFFFLYRCTRRLALVSGIRVCITQGVSFTILVDQALPTGSHLAT